MKKRFAVVLSTAMALSCVACSNSDTTPTTTAAEKTHAAAETTTEAEVTTAEETTANETQETTAEATADYMSYEEFLAAEVDTEVTVKAYVMDKQSWWDNKATVYATTDDDGAYFLYNMECSEEDYKLLTEGTKIIVTGYKAEWSGEIEITEATFEIVDDETYIVNPVDVTDYLGKDYLSDYMNQKVSFKGMTVEPITDADGNEAAFLYNWDGSGEDGNDLYFNVSVNGNTYNFTVESYLRGAGTEVYEAVKALQIGDVIDLEGYLYWYNGANPHITKVSEHIEEGSVMTYEEYVAAELDEFVTIEAYVQGKQSWWDDKATVYLQDEDGAYFAYNMTCSEVDYELLSVGNKIRVTGYKSEWSGEVEITDAVFELLYDDPVVFDPVDVTDKLGTDELIDYQNQKVEFLDMTIEAITDADGNEATFLYNWDGSGEEGNDLYFNVSYNGQTYTFTVESYLTGPDTDVYQTG